MTKEAKLTAAMRIITEWKDYDSEIKRLQLQLDEQAVEEEEQIQHVDKGELLSRVIILRKYVLTLEYGFPGF